MGKKRKGNYTKMRQNRATVKSTRDSLIPKTRPLVPRSFVKGKKTCPKSVEWSGNRYAGFKVPKEGWRPDVVNAADLTPEQFFELYVKTRTPVILQGHHGLGPHWKGGTWVEKDCARLIGAAGEELVQVEIREDTSQPFGQGRVRKMPFRSVMQSFLCGEEKMYMTTQDLPVDEEERPGLCSTPVAQLLEAKEFDMRPPLMGNLLPFNFNLWIGSSRTGSSSGLHHDYHDNLYVLLAGRKQFRLYSPADTEDMYTVGDVARVHPNGRINYKNALTQADGASEAAISSLVASRQLERAMQQTSTQKAAYSDEENSDAIEAALDAMLEAEMGEGGGFDDRDSGEDTPQEEKDNEGADGLPKIVPPPDNFSRVGSYRKDTSPWPRFSRCMAADAEIVVGQMLYLPAGWFHEVTSLSASPSSLSSLSLPSSSVSAAATTPSIPSSFTDASTPPQFHMAFNFWFHPPDQVAFSAPYSGDFWASDWTARGFTI